MLVKQDTYSVSESSEEEVVEVRKAIEKKPHHSKPLPKSAEKNATDTKDERKQKSSKHGDYYPEHDTVEETKRRKDDDITIEDNKMKTEGEEKSSSIQDILKGAKKSTEPPKVKLVLHHEIWYQR